MPGPFDEVGGSRLTEILAPNDPRAAQNQAIERERFGGDRESSFATFSRRSGSTTGDLLTGLRELSPRTTPAEVDEARKKKNPFVKYALGGNAFGVFNLPGGIKFINPLKTMFSGLEWAQKNLADPLAGLAFGGVVAPLGSKLTPFKKFDRMAENFRDQIRGAGSLIDVYNNAGDFNREREGLFMGEKFISSLVFDPTSYIGFGLLGKVPIVGRTVIRGGFKLGDLGRTGSIVAHAKDILPIPGVSRPLGGAALDPQQVRRVELSLGALEEAYVEAFNFPFRSLAKLYRNGIVIGGRKLPILGSKTRKQEARRAANIGAQIWTENITNGVGAQIGEITNTRVSAYLVSPLDLRIPITRLDNNQANIRKLLYQAAEPTDQDVAFLYALGAAEGPIEITAAGGIRIIEPEISIFAPFRSVTGFPDPPDEIAQLITRGGGVRTEDFTIRMAGGDLPATTERLRLRMDDARRILSRDPNVSESAAARNFASSIEEFGDEFLEQFPSVTGDDVWDRIDDLLVLPDGVSGEMLPLSEVVQRLRTRSEELTSRAQRTIDELGQIEGEAVEAAIERGRAIPVREGPPPTITDETGLEFITDAGLVAELSHTASIRETIHTMTTRYLTGTLGADELAEFVMRLAGTPMTTNGHRRIVSHLENLAARHLQKVRSDLSQLNGKEIADYIAVRESVRTISAIDKELALSRKGRVGGAVIQAFDEFQTKVYQNGLRKHVIHPMARMVLMFPAFPLQELMESQSRSLFGKGRIGFMSETTFDRYINYFEGVPASLRSFELANFTRAAQVEGSGGLEGLARAISDLIPGRDRLAKILDKAAFDIQGVRFNLLNPADQLRITNTISAATRRKYFISRSVHHQTSLLASEYPEWVPIIDNLSQDAIRGSERRAVMDQTLLALATGQRQAVLDVSKEFTSERIMQADLDSVLGKFLAPNEVSAASKRVLYEAVDSGTLTKENLGAFRDDIMAREWEEFQSSPEGAVAVFDALATAFSDEAIEAMGAQGVRTMMYQANAAMHYLNSAMEGVMRETARQVKVSKLNAAERQIMWDKTQDNIQKLIQETQPKMTALADRIKVAERINLPEGTNFSNEFLNDYAALSSGWHRDRDLVAAHFAKTPPGHRGQSFWDKLYEIRSEHWDEVSELRMEIKFRMDGVRDAVDNILGVPKAEKPKGGDFSRLTQLTPEHIAKIVGVQPQQITQGLFKAAFMSKREWTAYIKGMADTYGYRLPGNTDKVVGDVYSQVLRHIGLEDKWLTKFAAQEKALSGMFDELNATTGKIRFGEAQTAELSRYLEDVVRNMDAMSADDLGLLKAKGRRGMEQAVEDMKQAFVNYDDTTAIDDFMQGFFPFWTYETRRLPFLARQGFQSPIVWNLFMPEGRYWDETDNGYVDVAGVPWMQLNYFGGTMFNAPRRMFRAEFPPQHDSGFQGYVSSFEESIGRFGFYFGSHIQLLNEGILPAAGVGERGDLGEVVPPPVNIGLAAAEVALADIPGMSDAIRFMRRQILPDRFRQWQTGKILAERGLNPDDIDWDSWKIKDGITVTTQEDLDSASRLAALMEATQESLGNVRFRGPAEENLRETRDEVISYWTGFNQKDLDRLRRDGVDPLTQVALPGVIARALSELPGAKNFSAANRLLRGGERREFEDNVAEFWRLNTNKREQLTELQQVDDDNWLLGIQNGGIAPQTWRENLSKRKVEKVHFFDSLRGRRRLLLPNALGETTEVITGGESAPFFEVPITSAEREAAQLRFGNDLLRIQHPLDEWIEGYHAIVPMDQDGDGVPEYSVFFSKRRGYLATTVPEEFREAFFAEIERNQTDAERALNLMSRTVLGDYWLIDNEVAALMDLEDLIQDVRNAQIYDSVLAEGLRGDIRYRRWTKEVNRRKELERKTDPLLDYALKVFGFTTKFNSPTAESWWRADGERPSLGRFPGLR